MRSMRAVLILRGMMAAIVTALAVVAFTNGRAVVGVLLLLFAATNVALIVVIKRRPAELAKRFPKFAAGPGKPDDPADQPPA